MVSEEISKAECDFRIRLKHGRFCNCLKSSNFFKFCDEVSNVSFHVNTSDQTTSSNDSTVIGVTPFDINASLVTYLFMNKTTQETDVISTTILPLQNRRFYSVLGFEDFDNDSGNDIYVDLDLHVGANWTFPTKVPIQTLQSFLNNTNLSSSAIKGAHLKCVFIDTNESSLSDEGCESVSSPDLSHVTCICNHATVFTIVLSVSVEQVPYSVQVMFGFQN